LGGQVEVRPLRLATLWLLVEAVLLTIVAVVVVLVVC
jgi:hypothetical protein